MFQNRPGGMPPRYWPSFKQHRTPYYVRETIGDYEYEIGFATLAEMLAYLEKVKLNHVPKRPCEGAE